MNESLDVISAALTRMRQDLDLVIEQDAKVQAVPIEAFPLGVQPVVDEVSVGAMIFVADSDMLSDDPPEGYLWADGSSVSTTPYADLFAAIGYSYGGGGANFNVPNAMSRALIGVSDVGSGPQPNRALGATGGAGTLNLVANDLPAHDHAHTHSTPAHAHTMAHTHEFSHVHNTPSYSQDGGQPANIQNQNTLNANIPGGVTNINTSAPSSTTTGQPSTSVTSTDGSGTTGSGGASVGAGQAIDKMNPFLAVSIAIKFKNFATSSQPITSLAWGPVPAKWTLGNRSQFPDPSVTNIMMAVPNQEHPEPVLSVSSPSGSSSSYTQVVDFVVRLPYNWRAWKTVPVKVRTYVNFQGVTGTASVVLKVGDPLDAAGGFLADTYSRTGITAESSLTDAFLHKDQLGKTWKPGYALRLRLEITTPTAWSTADIRLGRLEIGWR
jgi:microcystin-dependent protein